MDFKESIPRLRIFAFLLFIIPTIALVGTLLVHNYLVSFNFEPGFKHNFEKTTPGNIEQIFCNEENNYCEINPTNYPREKLNDCIVNSLETTNIFKDDKLFSIKYEISQKENKNCIKNYNNLYKIFPLFYEAIYALKKNSKTNLGTSEVVNPFFYGETSISNIAKRYPLKFIFKPLLYLSAFFMVLYWIYFNKIFRNISNLERNFYFFKFGVLSAIFLFLHVFFLGWVFESEILTKLRRTFVVFFIFFEVMAQAFLIKQIFKFKNLVTNYLNLIVIYLKLIFVTFVCSFTFIMLTILIFYQLDAKIDYILEWNYFLILLLFYFLSFLMWKKI